MDKILIDIREYSDSFRKIFKNKDLITIQELLSSMEDLVYENEDLCEKNRKLKNKDDWEEEYIPEDY